LVRKDFNSATKDAPRVAYTDDNATFIPTERASSFVPKKSTEDNEVLFSKIGKTHYISATNAYARNTINWSPDGSLCAATWTMGSNGDASLRTRGTGLNYFTNAEEMNWAIPLVFSDFVSELDGKTPLALEIKTAGSTHIINIGSLSNFLTNIARNSSGYQNLNGLYIISFDDINDVPIIRALNIDNEGLIQNEGIIHIGD